MQRYSGRTHKLRRADTRITISYKRAYIYVDACLYVALKRRRVCAEDTLDKSQSHTL